MNKKIEDLLTQSKLLEKNVERLELLFDFYRKQMALFEDVKKSEQVLKDLTTHQKKNIQESLDCLKVVKAYISQIEEK